LLEQVRRPDTFGCCRAHPAFRRLALMFANRLSHITDQALLIEFPEIALPLSISAAMRDDLIAARANALKDLGVIVVEQRIDVMSGRHLQLIEKVEQTPNAN